MGTCGSILVFSALFCILIMKVCFLVGLGLELRASHLQSRPSTAWALLPLRENMFKKKTAASKLLQLSDV
jgi:hypothetical protein